MGIDEGLSFSDHDDESIPYDVKPTYAIQPMEELASLLTEVHLEDLYHATNEGSLIGILKSNSIKLTFAGGTMADDSLNKGRAFFLSTSRQKYGNYARGGRATNSDPYYEVIVHLNGRKLTADGFKIFPLDYWGHLGGGERSEQEERIVSDKDEIKPLEKYVYDIHVYVASDLKNPHTIDRFHQLNELAKTSTVPVYFYTNKSAFYLQKTNRAIRDISGIIARPEWTEDDLELKKSIEARLNDPSRWSNKASYLESLMKIYRGDPIDTTKYPDQNVMRMLLYYPHDVYSSLMADSHNYKTKHLPIFKEIVVAMRKEKVRTFRDFITLIMNREQEKEKQRRNDQR